MYRETSASASPFGPRDAIASMRPDESLRFPARRATPVHAQCTRFDADRKRTDRNASWRHAMERRAVAATRATVTNAGHRSMPPRLAPLLRRQESPPDVVWELSGDKRPPRHPHEGEVVSEEDDGGRRERGPASTSAAARSCSVCPALPDQVALRRLQLAWRARGRAREDEGFAGGALRAALRRRCGVEFAGAQSLRARLAYGRIIVVRDRAVRAKQQRSPLRICLSGT